ncbi:MAG: HAMP domain-containing histidine kinase [Myxococcales bacterium]|nr:HAMP domain-containing histidine kinase [Myxococcales bacterium]
MSGTITVLWLIDERDLPAERDERFRHVTGDPDRPGAVITGLLADGAVLAVVRSEEEGQRAIAYGADEVVVGSEALRGGFEKSLLRTNARARARMHRDLFLIDLIRKDDTAALELLSAALGEELLVPLSRASDESKGLVEELGRNGGPAQRASAIAETVAGAARVIEKMKELVSTEPTDEVVDLSRIARDVARELAPGVRPVAGLEVNVVDRPCRVGMPRWQLVMLVASLVENAVQSVAARGGPGRMVSVRVNVTEGAAVLEVQDDGMGMDEDERSYAADPFFTTSGRGRLGLGLTLVSARVRRAGGELVIESDPGVGTTVRAFLPLVGEPSVGPEPN